MARFEGDREIGGVKFFEIPQFTSDNIPTGKEVLERVSYLCMPKDTGRSNTKDSASKMVASEIIAIWESKGLQTMHQV